MATNLAVNFLEDEFMKIWFPELNSKSYIIPVAHFDHIHADITHIGDVPISVLRPKDDCAVPEIKKHDDVHKIVHSLFTQLKDHTVKNEVMVMMTQARFSMYSSLVLGANAIARKSKLEQTNYWKKNYSDLVIVNKMRGVLVGVVQSAHVSDHLKARQYLKESVNYLAEAARIVQELVLTVPKADNVPVCTTLILPNITRKQLENKELELQTTVQGVSCLCKDEMVTDECLKHWWNASWSSVQRIFYKDITIFKQLVTRFAIPATRVEIYLTTQPRLQLKHEHDVVNAVGDAHGADVFQARLHQLSLFPTQASLLEFEFMNETHDDVRFLWGPPGTGKTILLILRALQWVKHYNAQHIFILQTKKEGTAASCLIEYQLQQTLKAQQQHAQQSSTDTLSTQCTFIHVDMSGMWKEVWDEETGRRDKLVLKDGWKKALYRTLRLQKGGNSCTAIHIVADEANGNGVAAVYQWLKDEIVMTIRLWAAGVVAFEDKENIPDSLQHLICRVTEPLRCPGPVVWEVMKADQIKKWGSVPRYDMKWQLTDGPPVVQLHHYKTGRDKHTKDVPWRCGLCAMNIADRLRSLHVGEADEGRQGLSANDVFILGSVLECGVPGNDKRSPAPLISGLMEKGYEIRTLSGKLDKREVIEVVKRHVIPPAITVANESCVVGLERKIVVYFDHGVVGGGDADMTGRLLAFSRSTSLLIYLKTDWS